MNGFEVALDVDGGHDGSADITDLDGLAVGTGDTVALGSGGGDDQLEVGHARGDGRESEGEGTCGQGHGGGCRRVNADKGRRSCEGGASAFHDPEVQTGVEVRAGDLGRRSEHALAGLSVGECVPRKNLRVGEGFPAL